MRAASSRKNVYLKFYDLVEGKLAFECVNSDHSWLSPAYNNEVFERPQVFKTFFLILLLIIIGEFFASPAIALADSAVITQVRPTFQFF